MNQEKKIILVTGVAGFVGSYVAEKLLIRGDTIIGIDEINDYYDIHQKESNLNILKQYNAFYFYKEDLGNFNRK